MPSPLTPITAALIRLADAAYRHGTPLLSDAAFDRLSAAHPNALPPLTGPMLSLDCMPEPGEWLDRNPGPYVVQLKADGVSVNLVYVDGRFSHAHLRGGRDVTRAALAAGALLELPGCPAGTVEIRCEAIAPNATRNACAAALRRGTFDFRILLLAFDLHGIDGITTQRQSLDWLTCAGFGVLAGVLCHTTAEVLAQFDAFLAIRHTLPFACDGLTVKIDSKAKQRELGCYSRAPRYAISMKP